MSGPLRNDQVAMVALLVLGGHRGSVDTEDVAIEADKLSPGRFRWRKFKANIDLGLVRNGLQDARKRDFVSGGALKGWVLTRAGMLEASSLLGELADAETRERITTEQRQWEARERSRLLVEPSFQTAKEKGADALSEREVLRLFRLDEYASQERRSERLRQFLVSFSRDEVFSQVVADLARRLQQ